MALLRRLSRIKSPRMAKIAAGLALLAVLPLLGSCTGTAYVDTRREAGQKEPIGPSTPDMAAICYSKTGTGQATAAKMAESECAKTSRVPQLDHEDRWGCTMVAPRRIFYRCVPKS